MDFFADRRASASASEILGVEAGKGAGGGRGHHRGDWRSQPELAGPDSNSHRGETEMAESEFPLLRHGRNLLSLSTEQRQPGYSYETLRPKDECGMCSRSRLWQTRTR